MKKIAIFIADSNGCYPVPAVRGGAVSALVEHILKKCNEYEEYSVSVYTYYDEKAIESSKQYPNISFFWVKIPKFVKILDALVFKCFTILFPGKKSISFLSIISLFWYIGQCSRMLKKNQYDKIILENNVIISWIVKLSNYKGWYCYHLHNLPRTMAKADSVYKNCNAFYCVSNFMSRILCSENSPIIKLPAKKCKEFYNCIDTDHFKRCTDETQIQLYRDKYGVVDGDKVIVYVGRLSEEKGVDKLLEAVYLLKDRQIKILIVGALVYDTAIVDPYIMRLHKLSEDLKEQVVYAGYISQSELPIVYSISDIAILPSVWDEPAGLTMIEAMACGTPLITCASGGIPEYVGESAIVLNREDHLVENIAKNIRLLLENPQLRKEYAEKGMDRIRENFNLDKYYEEFKRVVETC